MKTAIISLIPCLFFVACLNKQAETLPVPQDELVKILLDVHVSEAALTTVQGTDKKDSLANVYYDQVVAIHKIDREMLDTCLAILQRNPEMAQEIYEKVKELAEKKKLVK